MLLPPALDEQARDRFDDLIKEGKQLIAEMEPLTEGWNVPRRIAPVCISEFGAFAVNSRNLLRRILSDSQERERYLRRLDELEPCIESTQVILGVLMGLRSDYEAGFLHRLQDLAIAEISADYLILAEELLDTQYELKGDYGPHIPAASVCGAVLEHFLRRLCQRQNPPIPLEYEVNGKQKNKLLNRLIEELQIGEVITVSKADLLRSWAKLRNSADHGKFAEAPPNDVKSMITGMKTFLEDMQ